MDKITTQRVGLRKNEVIKHSSAIQISNEINLLQRQTWNILLANAFDELEEKEEYSITIKDLCGTLKYDSRNLKHLKDLIRGLKETNVEWNILGKDGEEWGISSLLGEVSIVNGVCFYSYGPRFRKKLYKPAMYAKISLSLQNRFNSKHSLALYELFVDYYNVKRGFGATPVIPIEDFRKLLGLNDNEYKSFKALNKDVIKKAVEEINEKSDLSVRVEYTRARRVVAVKFYITGNPDNVINLKPLINANKQLSLPLPAFELDNMELYKVLTTEFGISNNKATEILKSKDEFYIEEVLDTVRDYIKKGTVQNIPAFTVVAIEEDYRRKTPKAEKEREARRKALEADKETELLSARQQEAQEQELLERALSQFEKLEGEERAGVLAEFRQYLVDTGNKIVVGRFDAEGVAPGAVEAMFGVFLKEKVLKFK
ncbi:RepB family plasmid replication initiator protein [Desulfoprunum benzoelyticum]|uniref:Plasmid replication initiation protein n=1 Tax=Desulfoprunum benzoelyticum TaxID=1506996 RepID=A0A840V741_9BACT|nr:RepB family plasmid replication initiator protein [Desulfoprunum benzoelyticum]MBB5349569.1 plasmid replication initiation protein [Desulfoprunum benzoelyticum]MBM9531322.1 RepB family plasmid replication initiator protein [Desulfoprunum benzoelyticum]